jgi:predicted nucleotidyltransferase
MEAFESLAPVFRKAGILVAYLFGSRARGDAQPHSDIDIAVLVDGGLGLLDRSRLAGRVADALRVTNVDVVVLDDAPLELRGRVVQEGRAIFSADEPRRVAFEVQTRSLYFDFLPTLKQHSRRYLRRVAEDGL